MSARRGRPAERAASRWPGRIAAVLAAAALAASWPVRTAASEDVYLSPDHRSYTTTYTGAPAEGPQPYAIEKVLLGAEIGCGSFDDPSDIFVADDGALYIADTSNNRIVVLEADGTFRRQYLGASIPGGGSPHLFNAPQGVFVAPDGDLYVADTENGAVVQMDDDGRLVRLLERPTGAVVSETLVFKPSRVVVDAVGRIFVVSLFVNQGILEYSPEGEFKGFLAAGKVNPSPIEVFWKRISTAAQRARMVDFVPIEYNNLALDDEGFIYATMAAMDKDILFSEIAAKTGTEEGTLVRRLNMLGNDILRQEGFFPPVGDVDILDYRVNLFGAYQGPSLIVDVSCASHGKFSLLDNNRKRIFVYDGEGDMLFAFGGPNSAVGGFVTPLSMDQGDGRYYVLDKQTGALTVFRVTEYGQHVLNAIDLYETGQYDASAAEWEQVLARNANMELAYSGIGKALYSKGDYAAAMRFFRDANDKSWYSKAYKEYRNALVAAWFPVPAAAVLALALFLFLRKLVRTTRGFLKGGTAP